MTTLKHAVSKSLVATWKNIYKLEMTVVWTNHFFCQRAIIKSTFMMNVYKRINNFFFFFIWAFVSHKSQKAHQSQYDSFNTYTRRLRRLLPVCGASGVIAFFCIAWCPILSNQQRLHTEIRSGRYVPLSASNNHHCSLHQRNLPPAGYVTSKHLGVMLVSC